MLKFLIRIILLLAVPALFLAVGFASSAMVQAQSGNPPLPVVNAPNAEHPRLLLTQSYIDQTLRPRMAQETVEWRHFISYVRSDAPEADMRTHPEAVMRSLALAYHLTGEADFATRSQSALLTLVQQVASHPVITGDAPWDRDFAANVAGIAIGYDWLYETLKDTDRTALRDLMLQSAYILNNPERDSGRVYVSNGEGSYRFAAYESDAIWALWAGTALAIALIGEDFRAPDLLDYNQNLFENWIIPALDAQSGGAWAEGVYYGFSAHWASVQMAAALWTARGENYFDDSAWWYDRLAYNLFLQYPGLVQSSDLYFWDYPPVFGDSLPQDDSAFYGRAQQLLLSTVFAGTEHAEWARWGLAQGEGAPMLQRWLAVEEFLWGADEDATSTVPPWLFWYTENTGHIFMRSAWVDESNALDEEATLITFHAGDHYASHQYFDQGSVTLWRAGDALLLPSGVYSGAGTQDQDVNHLSRTIAANTLLICDLAENFDGIRANTDREVWLNDCGQRPVFPNPASAINPYFQADNPLGYETGDIVRFSSEGSMSYFRANLTAAYNSTLVSSPGNRPKVQEVQRELVYIRPGALVIYDRILTPDPAFVPFNILHTASEPAYDGFWWHVEGENSQLYWAQVLPGMESQVVDAYEVAGESISVEGQRFGAYRLQTTATAPATQHQFLTLLLADDLDAPVPDLWNAVESAGILGVAWADWQVMFDDDPGNLSTAEFAVQAQAANILIIGLEPNASYSASLPDGTVQVLLADEAGTLYIFNEANGTVRLARN